MSETLTKESFTDSDWLEFNHRITMAKHDVEDFISSLAEMLVNNKLPDTQQIFKLVISYSCITQIVNI